MGKRSDFERVERDFYPTPYEAVVPLIPHLRREDYTSYIEPCAGNGALIDHLALFELSPYCMGGFDIEPRRWDIMQADVLAHDFPYTPTFITNPPWDRKILHPLIERLSDRGRTWLLFDAGWVYTKQSIPYLNRLRKVVAVGRVKWIPDTKMTGKDDCAWHLFTAPSDEPTVFVGRVK